jgi:hypothetical protein
MGYRIRVVPEVEQWLAELRESDPGAADLVDEALNLLRDQGAGLGPPLVVPVEAPVHETRPDLDFAYQRQLEMLTRARRAVANVATSRKRLELKIEQLEEMLSQLEDQRRLALEASDEVLAAFVQARQSFVGDQLADLHRQHADLRAAEERQTVADQRLQVKVEAFRTRKEAIKAAEAAAEAASEVDLAEAALSEAIAEAGGLGPNDPAVGPDAAAPRHVSSLALSELRPGAPESDAIRLLFTVERSGTAVLLAAGTERDWLRAWYAEMFLRCRARYERDQGSAG